MRNRLLIISLVILCTSCAHREVNNAEIEPSVEWLTEESLELPKTCPDGELFFAFQELPIKAAFGLLADFGNVGLYIAPEVGNISNEIYFSCTHWLTAAKGLAKRNNLTLILQDNTMIVKGK